MKKLATTLILSIGFLTSAFAQKEYIEKMSVEQKTELRLKKMILKLDLTSEQVKQIKPLLFRQIQEKKVMGEKRKTFKASNKKPMADERFVIKSEQLDKLITFKKAMKRILSEKQYEKFEKKMNRKMKKGKRKGENKKKKRK